MNILVIGGHPADVFDHCGGTMLHHVRAGDRVTCLALTQGLRVHDVVVSEVFRFGTEGYSEEDIARICEERERIKFNEVREACALFGITDVRSLRYDDKLLLVKDELIDAVAKVIRDVRPELLITHFPMSNGNTMDHHGNAAKIAIAASHLAGTVDFDDPNPAWRIADIAFMLNGGDTTAYTALSAYNTAHPNYFVDVTDVVDIKVKALDLMRSQQYQGLYARKVVSSENGGFGIYTSAAYCEAFMLNKPVVSDKISICEHWLQRANEPELDRLTRDHRMIAAHVPMPD